MNNETKSTLDNFIKNKNIFKTDGNMNYIDMTTGEPLLIRDKDEIVERVNKKYVTNDGRQLLQD